MESTPIGSCWQLGMALGLGLLVAAYAPTSRAAAGGEVVAMAAEVSAALMAASVLLTLCVAACASTRMAGARSAGTNDSSQDPNGCRITACPVLTSPPSM